MKKESIEYIAYLIMDEIRKADEDSRINIMENELDIIEQIIFKTLEEINSILL